MENKIIEVRFGACPFRLANPNHTTVSESACFKRDCLAFDTRVSLLNSLSMDIRPYCTAINIYLDERG
uniref:Uncharacterized protein n=1 Tax=viral metagenome TaxID=1070528 RepID=A0A6H2A1M7_9ZZZZ